MEVLEKIKSQLPFNLTKGHILTLGQLNSTLGGGRC
jgi:hypothetical protein